MRISDWSSDVCSSDLGNVTIQSDNAFLPQSVRDELALQGIDEFKLGTTNANLPVRKNDTRRELQRYVVGANGEFDLFGSSARWDVYYQDRKSTRLNSSH